MANCKKFNELTPMERCLFIAKLSHAVQSDNTLYYAAIKIIESGRLKGVFEGVVFNPPIEEYLNNKYNNK